jgi:hypothetical protein
MIKLLSILFCLSLSAQTLTHKLTVAAKPDAISFTVPDITVTTTGDTLFAVVAIDAVGIRAYWNGAELPAAQGAANFGKGGRNYSSGVRQFVFPVFNASGTGAFRFDFTRDCYGIVVAVYESDIHSGNGIGEPVGGWAGPTANPAAGPLQTSGPNSLLLAALGTEGPPSDAPGFWPSDWTDCGRWGTVGGKADANITLSVGCRVVDTVGPYNVSKSGVTPRYWALSLGSYVP